MGRFRWLIKPTKRYFFAYADKVSDKWIHIVSKKYTLKYINKINKIKSDFSVDAEALDPSEYYLIPGLDIYREKLIEVLHNEKGLGHSKVREYWLRRGPRLLLILLLTISVTIGFAELLLDVSYEEHMYSMLVGINMFLYSVYMLYARLIDSIAGNMMRKGHDHYNKWKNNFIMREATIPSQSLSIKITPL